MSDNRELRLDHVRQEEPLNERVTANIIKWAAAYLTVLAFFATVFPFFNQAWGWAVAVSAALLLWFASMWIVAKQRARNLELTDRLARMQDQIAKAHEDAEAGVRATLAAREQQVSAADMRVSHSFNELNNAFSLLEVEFLDAVDAVVHSDEDYLKAHSLLPVTGGRLDTAYDEHVRKAMRTACTVIDAKLGPGLNCSINLKTLRWNASRKDFQYRVKAREGDLVAGRRLPDEQVANRFVRDNALYDWLLYRSRSGVLQVDNIEDWLKTHGVSATDDPYQWPAPGEFRDIYKSCLLVPVWGEIGRWYKEPKLTVQNRDVLGILCLDSTKEAALHGQYIQQIAGQVAINIFSVMRNYLATKAHLQYLGKERGK